MPRPTNEQRLAKVHAEALAQFDAIQEAVRDERLQCLEDRRFYSIAGAQWEGKYGEQFENKPKFEVNKVHLAVIRIFNEYRNNRITVNFVPKDGTKNDKLAETCNGLYRADEQDSVAEEAYDNAFEEAVGGGFGAWRLRACYEDEEDGENENQRIRIEPIYDADSCVFFDLNAKRQDKADAKHCFVLNSQTVASYIDEWGDDPASWPKEIQSTIFDWNTPDVVYVAEYYKVEGGKDELVTFVDIQGEEETYLASELNDDDGELLDKLLAIGNKEVKRRKIKTKLIHKYIMSGSKILEDCGIIAGKRIPIVPVYGKRWFVDGIERCMGHVRLAKDAQRLKNMQLSKLGEIAALSSVEKPIVAPEQMTGNQVMWQDDNLKNYPYLLLNSMTDKDGNAMPAGPLAYTKPPQVPPAMAALLQVTEQDMQEILGNAQQAEKMVSNISGKAIELIQTRLDMQTFIYMSNMAKADKCGGEIWLSMAKPIYGSQPKRKMKTIGEQDEVGSVELKRPVLDEESGEVKFENDLSEANLDVAVTVGPSSISRKEATVRSLTTMMGMTQDPETAQVLQAMAMLNMEGEGIADVRDFFRKRLVKLGALKPNDDEAEAMAAELANAQPDPNAVYLQAAAANEEAKAKKAQADSINALADAALTRAKTLETMATMDINEQNHALEIAQQMDEVINQDQQPSLWQKLRNSVTGKNSGTQPPAPPAAIEGMQ